MAAKLVEAGVAHKFVTIEDKDHGLFYSPRKSGIDDHSLVVAFLRERMPVTPPEVGRP